MSTTDWEAGVITPAASKSKKGIDWDSGTITPMPEKPGILRGLGDTGVAVGRGLASGLQNVAAVAGADNPVAKTLGGAADAIGSLESDYRQAQRRNDQAAIEKAQKSGSTLDEVGAYLKSFAHAPFDTSVESLGSIVPSLAAAALTKGKVNPLMVGAVQGVGETKQQIYDDTKQKALSEGLTEQQAAEKASQAQAYGVGDNNKQLAIAAGLGALAGGTGIQPAVSRIVHGSADAVEKSLLKRGVAGALEEAIPEAVQGGQQQYASNIAQQGQGFDTPTGQGIAGNMAISAAASLLPGAAFAIPGHHQVSTEVDPNAGPVSKALTEHPGAVPLPTGGAAVIHAPEQNAPGVPVQTWFDQIDQNGRRDIVKNLQGDFRPQALEMMIALRNPNTPAEMRPYFADRLQQLIQQSDMPTFTPPEGAIRVDENGVATPETPQQAAEANQKRQSIQAFTDAAKAQESAAAQEAKTGQPHEVVPHPIMDNALAVVPATQETQNAQQNTEAGPANGGGSAQPEIRQEGGNTAVSGAGLQPGGQGQQTSPGSNAGETAPKEPVIAPKEDVFDSTHAATAALYDPRSAAVRQAWHDAHFTTAPDGTVSRKQFDHFETWYDGGGVTEGVGSKYDAHGIAKGNQLGALLNLLRNGVSPGRSFDTAPLVSASGSGSGVGLGTASGGAYKDGAFIVMSGRGETIKDNGIKNVLVSDAVSHTIPALQAEFPHINFIPYSKAQEALAAQTAASSGEQTAKTETQPALPSTAETQPAPATAIPTEQSTVQPLAESQAPSTSEQGDAGVTPGKAGGLSAQTGQAIRPTVEALIKRRQAAKEADLGSVFKNAFDKAKAVMDGTESGKAGYFKMVAKRFEKKRDPETAKLFMAIHDHIKATEELAKSVRQEAGQPAANLPAESANKTVKTKSGKKVSTNLMGRIRQLGGINVKYRSDVVGEKQSPVVGLFSKNGMGLDDLATALAAEHFPIDLNDHADTGGTNQLIDLIREHMAGREVRPIEDQTETWKREEEKRHVKELVADAQTKGIDTAGMEIKAIEDALAALTATATPETEAWVDDAENAIPDFDAPGNMSDAEVAALFGMSEGEINGAEKRNPEDATQAVGGQTGQNEPQTAANRQKNAGTETAFALSQQTEGELKAKAETQAKNDKQKAEAEAKVEARRQVDAEIGGFQLSGSNRPADMPGQADLLSGTKQEVITPVDKAAHQAATSPKNGLPEPTQGQKEAGNYQKGHTTVAGLNISIENPAGSVRSGTDQDGKTWSVTMKDHYGYILGTTGKDKDHIDVFIKPGTPQDYSGRVYVVDQKNPKTGKFDEHKVMLGWSSAMDSQVAYKSNYSDGWDGIGSFIGFSMDEFKDWLSSGDHTKPAELHSRGTSWATGTTATLPKPTEAAARANPKNRITFDNITGPTGYSLTGYEWAWKPFDYVDRTGENRAGRESDWENAESNIETGRDVVHKFTVRAPDGTESTVSLESAMQKLGFAEAEKLAVDSVARLAKTVAKSRMALAEMQPVAEKFDKATAEVDALPRPGVVDDGSGWKRMGDAKARWMADSDNAERMRVLKDAWRSNRMAERGFKSYAATPHQIIADIEAKIARAEKKLKAATEAAAQPEANAAPENRDKQANTEDAGQELTYNKRNRITSGLKWDDIKDKDAALRIRETTKQKVYPRPDYQALIDGGVPQLAAHIVKQAYDSLSVKPATRGAPTDEQLQTFIDGVNHYMNGVMAWANNEDSINNWLNSLAGRAKTMLDTMRGTPTGVTSMAARADRSLLSAVYPNGWNERIGELRLIGGNKAAGALQPGTQEAINAMQDIEKGWPGRQEAWQKQGYQIIDGNTITPSYYEGSRSSTSEDYVAASMKAGKETIKTLWIDGTKDKNSPLVKAAVDEFMAGVKDRFVILDKRGNFVSSHQTEEAAKDAAREATKRENKPQISEKGISVTAAERVGEERRKEGENVSTEQVMEAFGFRGINFGNWLKGDSNKAERQLHLNHTYDSFMDLADLLGVPPKAMSLNGLLGLAIGAQGTGSAAAHFVPGVNEINLTRTSGAGSLAHEWGHAVDHYFARQAGLERNSDPFLSVYARGKATKPVTVWEGNTPKTVERSAFADLRPEIFNSFKAIVEAMNKRLITPEEAAKQTDDAGNRAKMTLNSWLKSVKSISGLKEDAEFQKIVERIRTGNLGEGKIKLGQRTYVSPAVADLAAYIKKTNGRAYPTDQLRGLESAAHFAGYIKSEKVATKDHIPQMVRSNYSVEAGKLDSEKGGKPYWNTEYEKFARAFDAFVSDTLEAKAAKNSYLSHAGRQDETTPQGKEREAINEGFRTLIGQFKTAETESGTTIYEPEAGYTAREEQNGYQTDLFGNSIQRPAPAKSGKRRVSGNMDTANAIPDRGAPKGTYASQTALVSEVNRDLGTSRITSVQEAAQAAAYLGKHAVERFDAIITDKSGYPLAIVGAFKGAINQTSVYPSTVMAEAIRIPGAAEIWFAHNHPSGIAELSTADRMVARTLRKAFYGTGINPRGIFAVTNNGDWVYDEDGNTEKGRANVAAQPSSVKVVERVYRTSDKLGDAITAPNTMKFVIPKVAGGKSGLVLLDSQNQPIAFVPMKAREALPLKNNGRLGALYRAISVANANTAILHDPDGKFSREQYQNIGSALAQVDVRMLDILSAGQSLAEQGLSLTHPGGTVFSRKSPVFYSSLAKAFSQAKQESMPAGMWKAWLNSNAAKLGLKKDEIEWSGINDFLDMQGKAKVSKADVLNYLNDSGVNVQDVILKEGGRTSLSSSQEDDVYAEVSREMFGRSTGNLSQDEYETVAAEAGKRISAENSKLRENTPAKFSQYVPPGGIPGTYREILVTLPAERRAVPEDDVIAQAKVDAEGAGVRWDGVGPLTQRRYIDAARNRFETSGVGFRSSHFDQPNILVHLRTDEVTGADGKRYLRVIEVQSDWGQKGKKEGFGNRLPVGKLDWAKDKDTWFAYKHGHNFYVTEMPDGRFEADGGSVQTVYFASLAEAKQALEDGALSRADKNVVPSAPFVTDTKAWVSLGIKRAIQQAVSSGVDGIVFATGQQNADLYDLSKQVDSVKANKTPSGKYQVSVRRVDGGAFEAIGVKEESELEDAVGKDLAKKIIEDGGGTYSGLDLKVGGEGMRAFYDTIVPSVANDVLKKLGGGKVEQIKFDLPVSDGETTQPGFTIPEPLRNKIAAEGMPLFKQAEATTNGQTVTGAVSKAEFDSTIKAVTGKWKRPDGAKGQVIGVETVNDLPLAIIKSAAEQNTPKEQIKGVYHNGNIYIVRENMKDARDVELTIFHEAYGHFGARLMVGNDITALNQAFGKLWMRAGGLDGVRQMAKQFGVQDQLEPYIRSLAKSALPINVKHRIIMDELMAHVAGRGDFTLKEQFKAYMGALRIALRNAARAMGLNRLADAFDSFNDNELLASIKQMREAVVRGETTGVPAILAGTNANNDLPAFSRMEDARAAISTRVSDALTTQKTFNNWWHKTVATQYHKAQVDGHFRRVFNATQSYISSMSMFANNAADLAPDLLPQLNSLRDIWKKSVSEKDIKAVSDPIFTGTLVDEKVYSPAELRGQFNLTDHQIDLYVQFRASVDKSLDNLGKTDMLRFAGKDGDAVRKQVLDAPTATQAGVILSDHLNSIGKEDDAKLVLDKGAKIADLKNSGYAPLTRFGRHTLYVTNARGDQLYFGLFESQMEANAMSRKMREDNPSATITQGILSSEAYKLFAGISPETLELFADALGVENKEIVQEYIKMAKSNRNAMKRLIHRKGVAGFNEDVPRVLASFLTSNSRLAAQNLYVGEMEKAADAIPKEKGDVKDEAIKLIDFVRSSGEEASKIRGLLFVQYIGGSVASALVNMTQPITMSYPYLHQFSKNAGTELAKGMKYAAAGGNLDEDLKKALKQAENDGVVSPQEIHQLQAEAVKRGAGIGAVMRMFGVKGDLANHADTISRKGLFLWGSMFSMAEQFNRRATFIAAYNIARQRGEADPFAFAEKAVVETQGIYNKGNRPDWSRGALGATIFTFKQFSISYMEFLKRLPPKERAIALAILLLGAGANGIPFADNLDDLIDTLAQQMGYAFNTKEEKQKFLASILGQTGANFMLYGTSALPGVPIDFSARLGMNNLIPGTGILLKNKTDKSGDVFQVLGPAGGVVRDALNGNFLPVALRNVLKAKDMALTGDYRDYAGRKVIDTDAVDAAMKAVGFQPASVAEESRAARMDMQDVQLVRNIEAEIASKFAQGVFEQNKDMVAEAKDDLSNWNRKNPDKPIAISTQQIMSRVKSMQMSRRQRIIKSAPKELRGQLVQQ